MLGFAFTLTRKGSRPAFVCSIIAPEVRSLYSTEGMPLIISTDSMLSVDTSRVSMPALAEAPPAIEVTAPFNDGLSALRLALFDKGAPSWIMAVPKEFI